MSKQFKHYLENVKTFVETQLSDLTTKLSESYLFPQLQYSLLSAGKRLRPILVILSAESVGGRRDNVISLALALELIHTASLIHDDIIDESELRRKTRSLHVEWSVHDAILTGDALIALSIQLISQYGEQVIKRVAKTAFNLANAEQMEKDLTFESATEEKYFRIVRDKTASLFSSAVYTGALVGGGNEIEIKALTDFAKKFGIAYQLYDDIRDMYGKSTKIAEDLQSKRLTLPLIYTFKNLPSREKNQFKHDFHSLKSESPRSIPKRIQEYLFKTDSYTYIQKKKKKFLHAARESLTTFPENKFKTFFLELTSFLEEVNDFEKYRAVFQ